MRSAFRDSVNNVKTIRKHGHEVIFGLDATNLSHYLSLTNSNNTSNNTIIPILLFLQILPILIENEPLIASNSIFHIGRARQIYERIESLSRNSSPLPNDTYLPEVRSTLPSLQVRVECTPRQFRSGSRAGCRRDMLPSMGYCFLVCCRLGQPTILVPTNGEI